MKSIDDSRRDLNFTTAKTGADRTVTFLPEPERADRRYTVISVDDHIVEPPHTFEGRVPMKFADRAPRVVDTDDGGQTWMYDGHSLPNVGFNAVVGRPVGEYGFEPARFDEMRRGAWDIHARVTDMDLNGVYASLNFPSFLPGFAGQRLQQVTDDRDLAMASRAGLERLASRGVGRHLPRPDHSLPAAVAARSRSRREDDLRERRTWLPRDDVQREPGDAGTSDHPLGSLGPADGGMRRDGHGGEPAHRLVGHVARRPPTTRRPMCSACCSSPTPSPPRWTGCTPACAPVPRPEDLPVRRRDRLGGRASRPARPHAELPRDVRDVAGAR